VQRDTIRMAFVGPLQYLPPRQCAVLILRVVLCRSPDDVAQLLDTSVASPTVRFNALARHFCQRRPSTTAMQPMNRSQTELLARACNARERYRVETLFSLLHEDATFSMSRPSDGCVAGSRSAKPRLPPGSRAKASSDTNPGDRACRP
jgi:RNA polymerase sigma-70 factor, ECF subfamily